MLYIHSYAHVGGYRKYTYVKWDTITEIIVLITYYELMERCLSSYIV